MKTNITSVFMLLLVGLLWGLNWTAVKFMMSEIPPYTIRAIAFPLAAASLAIISLLQGHSLRPVAAERLPLIVASCFLIFGFNMLTSWGQSLSEASNAAIIAYTMPAMTAALSALYLKEKLTRRILLAIGLGMTGVAVLASGNLTALVSSPLGTIAMLLAAFCWSVGNITVKSQQWHLAPPALAAWFFFIATLLCWPVVWLLEPPSELQWPSTAVVLTMAFHVLGPMVTCYQLWNLLLSRLSASVAAISILTAPVVGVVSAVIFLGDALTAYKVLALCLIIASIFITLQRQANR